MSKKEPKTLPTTSSKKETTIMTAPTSTAKDIKKIKEPGTFSEKMQALMVQSEREEQELIDSLENQKTAAGTDGKEKVHPEDLTITRPPSYGKLVAECLNYG